MAAAAATSHRSCACQRASCQPHKHLIRAPSLAPSSSQFGAPTARAAASLAPTLVGGIPKKIHLGAVCSSFAERLAGGVAAAFDAAVAADQGGAEGAGAAEAAATPAIYVATRQCVRRRRRFAFSGRGLLTFPRSVAPRRIHAAGVAAGEGLARSFKQQTEAFANFENFVLAVLPESHPDVQARRRAAPLLQRGRFRAQDAAS